MLCLIAQSSAAQENQIDSTEQKILNNNAFGNGEKLEYDLKYGFISAGIASLSVSLVQLGPNYYYHYKAVAKTQGVKAKLVKIYDVYESYADILTGLPIKATRDINEQKYHVYNEIIFNRPNNVVYSANKGLIDVPPGIMDILGSYYHARRFLFNTTLEKNQIITLNTFFDNDIFPLQIRFSKKETVRTKFGKIEALIFIPQAFKDSPFKKEEDFKIWFSADRNFVPLKIEAKMKVGKVKMELINYSGLKNPEKSVLLNTK